MTMRVLLSASLIAVATACAVKPGPLRARETAQPHAAPDASPQAQPDAEPHTDPTTGAESQAVPKAVIDEHGCVHNPLAHAGQFILDHHAARVAERLGRVPELADFNATSSCLSISSLPDLDGDETDETEVVEECSWGTYAGLHLLYFSNQGCPRFAGDLINGGLSPLGTKGAGVRDLEATWSNGCAGGDFAWTHYRWDGSAYRVVDRATCDLCPDPTVSRPPPHANSHSYCKAEAKKRGISTRSTK
jgi:hypothetical protein